MNIENSTNFSLSDVEANLHMNLCKLSFILTRNTRNILIDVIKGITQYTIEQISAPTKSESIVNETNTKPTKLLPFHNICTTLTDSMKKLRNIYLEGKNSILSNLPRPKIYVEKDHAYVSIIDIIAHLLGFGIFLEPIQTYGCQHNPISHVRECSKSQIILKNSYDYNLQKKKY